MHKRPYSPTGTEDRGYENVSRADGSLTNAGLLTSIWLPVLLVVFACLYIERANAGQIESHQRIVEAATAHVRTSREAKRLDGLEVTAKPLDPRLQLARCDEALRTFDPYDSPLRQRMTVGVACDGAKPWKIFVPVSVSATTRVVVLTRSLRRGTRIGPDDVAIETRNIFPGTSPLLSNTRDALGQTLARGLPQGMALTTGMVKPPRLVSRGDRITLIVSYRSLEVRSVGEALEDGVVGQKIALTNVDSRRTVEGWVQKDGTVLVSR